MLRNLKSPETYFQAAFRVQSPWSIKNPNGDNPNEEEILKPICFVFDFAPTRALRQLSEYGLKGKFTIGGGVAAAAGPVGRQAEAGTDARLQAEIFSYSRSRGLFAGLALDGSVIQVDTKSNVAYYGVASAGQAGQPVTPPPSAVRLLQEIAKYTGIKAEASSVVDLPAGSGAADVQALPRELANSARQLSSILDESWKQYLALPAEDSGTDSMPAADALKKLLDRFDRVAKDPQYQALAQKPDFAKLSPEEQEKRIREATIFLTNGFVRINRSVTRQGRVLR